MSHPTQSNDLNERTSREFRAAASQDIPKWRRRSCNASTPGCPETQLCSAHAPPCTSRSSRCGIDSPYFRKFGGAHGLAAASPPATTRFPVFGALREREMPPGWHALCDERSHGAASTDPSVRRNPEECVGLRRRNHPSIHPFTRNAFPGDKLIRTRIRSENGAPGTTRTCDTRFRKPGYHCSATH